MPEPIIRVENLGKRYSLCHQAGGPRYRALRDILSEGVTNGFGLFGARAAATREEFWALKDVSFEVNEGEVVGIIGRNGAGKSTLLKILSRITEPTTGRVTLNGRVASLLEVGTGFHPELTGRENIYINGSILGMSRSEIARKFDEIVAFAEVEKFLDTPVKRYSSGMGVRLGFAVAAHLEPEILVVDEVLAVGDAAFQKKCLGKMGEVARAGRTVLFVSHNMQTIGSLCQSVRLLDGGALRYQGEVVGGIAHYYRTLDASQRDGTDAQRRPGTGEFRFLHAASDASEYRPHEVKVIRFRVRPMTNSTPRVSLSAHLTDATGGLVCQCDSRFLGVHVNLSQGECEGALAITTPWLKPGEYAVDLFLVDGNVGVVDRFERACQFRVLPILPYPDIGPEPGFSQGAVLGQFSWTVSTTGPTEGNRVLAE